MINWKLDFEDGYYRIFDSSNLITGYFDPDYGDLSSFKNPEEVILSKIKQHEKILGGMIMIPLVKFRLFDTDVSWSANRTSIYQISFVCVEVI